MGPKIEASERGSCQEDPEGKGWPWTEDCEPSQCQHQLSNQHLPPWTEGMLLRPLCRPLCLRTFMHCSRSLCKPSFGFWPKCPRIALRIIVFFPIKTTAWPLRDIRICCICLDPTLSASTMKHFGYSSKSWTSLVK